MSYKSKVTMDTTDNRSIYNKMRKRYLENKGLIHCDICPYNRGENDERKWYGSTFDWREFQKIRRVRYPNWKLVSKNRKQWMNKPMKIERINYRYWIEHFEIKF